MPVKIRPKEPMVLNPDGSWDRLHDRLLAVFFDGVSCVPPSKQEAELILIASDPSSICYEWVNWIYRESGVMKKVYARYRPSSSEMSEIRALLKPLLEKLESRPREARKTWHWWF